MEVDLLSFKLSHIAAYLTIFKKVLLLFFLVLCLVKKQEETMEDHMHKNNQIQYNISKWFPEDRTYRTSKPTKAIEVSGVNDMKILTISRGGYWG